MIQYLKLLNPYMVIAAMGVAAATFAGGFFAGKKWEKAELVDDYVEAIAMFQEEANSLIQTQDERWNSAITEVRGNLNEWALQNETDEALILRLIEGQDALRRDFRGMETEIMVVDVGTCSFSPDAVRLLKSATAAANAAAGNPGPGGSDTPASPGEASGGNEGL